MMPLHTLACLVVCLAQPPGVEPPDLAEGIYGLTCRVLRLQGKELVLVLEDGWRIFRVQTTDKTQLSLLDFVAKDGKGQMVRKPIRLADLKRGQRVGITIFTDGKEAQLLSAVATGPGFAGGERVLQFVVVLGGKAKQIPQYPRGKGPVRWDIDLSGTKTTDRDLVILGKLAELADLNLAFTAVTDEGLKHLRKLPELYRLDLTGTKITDEAVRTLRDFPKLTTLAVAQTGVTQDGAEELLRHFSYFSLCRLASGKKAHFRILEEFREKKLHKKELMIGDALFAIAFPHARPEPGRDYDPGRLATTYYHRNGPVGQVLAKFNWFWSFPGPDRHHADARLPASVVALCAGARGLPDSALVGLWSQPAVAVIRLDAGTHACYAQPYQSFDFYDNTPALQQFSVPRRGQPRVFEFVHDALGRGANVRILKGEERATLARKGPKQFYSALFAESTREDLRDINTGLMTAEGMAALMASLREDGILCYHTSHRYNDFSKPLAAAAKKLGFAWKQALDKGGRLGGPSLDREAHFGSSWFVVARKAEYLDHLRNQGTVEWSVPTAEGNHLWVDRRPPNLKAIEYKRR